MHPTNQYRPALRRQLEYLKRDLDRFGVDTDLDYIGALDGERRALESFLQFARKHRDVYRIIDEAEFVEPRAYRDHYQTTASRIAARLIAARDKGKISSGYSDDELDILAWAIMGANVFLGLRFSVWASADPKRVAELTSRMLRSGLER